MSKKGEGRGGRNKESVTSKNFKWKGWDEAFSCGYLSGLSMKPVNWVYFYPWNRG
jgi:hypothetical protein